MWRKKIKLRLNDFIIICRIAFILFFKKSSSKDHFSFNVFLHSSLLKKHDYSFNDKSSITTIYIHKAAENLKNAFCMG